MIFPNGEQIELNLPDFVEQQVSEVESNADIYNSIADTIMNMYSGDLDILMQDLKRDAIDSDADDITLEKYLLELGNMLYFLGSKLEAVGIRDDISKSIEKEVFNNSYLSNREKDHERKNKLTVAELTAIAENDSKYNSVLNSIYSRVYKQLKYKIDAGYEMVNSLRKIITRRMQEINLSSVNFRSSLNIKKDMVNE